MCGENNPLGVRNKQKETEQPPTDHPSRVRTPLHREPSLPQQRGSVGQGSTQPGRKGPRTQPPSRTPWLRPSEAERLHWGATAMKAG